MLSKVFLPSQYCARFYFWFLQPLSGGILISLLLFVPAQGQNWQEFLETEPSAFKPEVTGEFFTEGRPAKFRVRIGQVSQEKALFLYDDLEAKAPLLRTLYELEGSKIKRIQMNHLAQNFKLMTEVKGSTIEIQKGSKKRTLEFDLSRPLVTHGNFYLFLKGSKSKLAKSEDVSYQFLVPEDFRLVEMKMSSSGQTPDGRWNLVLEATSGLIRLVLRPFHLEFDPLKEIIVAGEVLEPIYSKDRMRVRYFSTRSGQISD